MLWLLNLHLYVLICLAPASTAGCPQVIAMPLQKRRFSLKVHTVIFFDIGVYSKTRGCVL